VDARLRHIRDLRDVTDDAVQLRRLLWRDRLRARERQRDAVAEPPGAEVHEERDAERERYGGLSEEEPRAEDEQEREDREETNGLNSVWHFEVRYPESPDLVSQDQCYLSRTVLLDRPHSFSDACLQAD